MALLSQIRHTDRGVTQPKSLMIVQNFYVMYRANLCFASSILLVMSKYLPKRRCNEKYFSSKIHFTSKTEYIKFEKGTVPLLNHP